MIEMDRPAIRHQAANNTGRKINYQHAPGNYGIDIAGSSCF
jgi:hypothetical protein